MNIDQNTMMAIIAGVVIVGVIAFFVFIKSGKAKPTKATKSNVNLERLFSALGGKENITSSEANGSKIVFTLVNPKAIIQEELKALGASGIVASKDKVTVIFGKTSDVLVEEIKQSL